jgi:hypothetical protein
MRRGGAGWWGRHKRSQGRHHGGEKLAALWRAPSRHHNPTARPQYADELAHRGIHVCRIEEAVHGGDRIERAVGERQSLQITLAHIGRGDTLPHYG